MPMGRAGKETGAMTYKIIASDRKEVTQQMEALTGERPSYTRAPRFAYILRGVTVEKNGTVTAGEDADLELVGQLIEAGLIAAPDGAEAQEAEAVTETQENETEGGAEMQEAETVTEMQEAGADAGSGSETETGQPEAEDDEADSGEAAEDESEEPAGQQTEAAEAEAAGDAGTEETEDAQTAGIEESETMDDDDGYGSIVEHEERRETVRPSFSFPLGQHRTESILNLVFTIYSKGGLISKSTQGEFSASEELVEELQSGRILRIEEAFETIKDAGEGALKGLTFEKDKVTFDGFPATDDQATIDAWLALATAINRTAIRQNRIRAKLTDETNEKFAFRTWLTRLGMNGADMKAERNILYRHLSGHTEFRTAADQEKWTKRQNEKRDALRALKEAAEEEAAGHDGGD